MKKTISVTLNFYLAKMTASSPSIKIYKPIDHFTVICLVVWPLNESEAGGDFVLIETSLPLLC